MNTNTTESKYQIIKGLPIPPARVKEKSALRIAIEGMEVGDCIQLDPEVHSHPQVSAAGQSARYQSKNTKKFTVRLLRNAKGSPMHVSIWRVE